MPRSSHHELPAVPRPSGTPTTPPTLSLLSKLSELAANFADRMWTLQPGLCPTYVLHKDEHGHPHAEPERATFFDSHVTATGSQRRASLASAASSSSTSTSRRNSLRATRSATPSDFEACAHGDQPESLRRDSSLLSSRRRRSSTTGAADHATSDLLAHAKSWTVTPRHGNLTVTESPAEAALETREHVRRPSSGRMTPSPKSFEEEFPPSSMAAQPEPGSPSADSPNEAVPAPPLLARRKRFLESAWDKSLDERRIEALGESPLTKNVVSRQDYKRELIRIERLSFAATNQREDEIQCLKWVANRDSKHASHTSRSHVCVRVYVCCVSVYVCVHVCVHMH
eukprot:Opistho-1_new@45531